METIQSTVAYNVDNAAAVSSSDSVRSVRICPQVVADNINLLWEPAEVDTIVADLCFVHGLMGHPRTTWQYGKPQKPKPPRKKEKETKNKKRKTSRLRNIFSSNKKAEADSRSDRSQGGTSSEQESDRAGSKKGGQYCFWPFDLLPNDFNNIRVLTYGYDSSPSHFYVGGTNQMTISQHAVKLLQKVTDVRQECRKRPIIFVAHSLGGILVKDMLIESAKHTYQPELRDVSESCFAIFFFGTPHRGANAAAYGEIMSNVVGFLPGGPSVYKEILRGLKPDGEKLSNVEKDFNDILNKDIRPGEKLKIYSFQEGKPVSGVKGFDGKVTRTY